MDDNLYWGQLLKEEYSFDNVSWRLGRINEEEERYPIFAVSSLSSYCDLTDHIRKAWSHKAEKRLNGRQPEQTEHAEQTDPSEQRTNRGYVGEILPWFRGVRDTDYTLTPMLAREWYKYSHKYESLKQLEDYYYDRFTRFGRPFLGNVIPNDIIEWNYIMRHHDIPSRLLDWTKGSLIALSYASMRSLEPNRRNTSDPKKAAAVWMLEPRRLMEVATRCLPTIVSGTRNIPTRADEIRAMRRDFFLVDPLNQPLKQNPLQQKARIYEELSNLTWIKNNSRESKDYWEYPLPLIPSHISARVGSHLSRFTLHSLSASWSKEPPKHDQGMISFSKKAFEEDGDNYWYLIKIEIPAVHLPQIARGLRMTGVGDMNFTQDLDGLSRELRMRADIGLKDDSPEHT
ncbi:MAG: FRG domain-containing protein [Bacteroidota bacterium]